MKKEKISLLEKAMEVKTRDDKTEFICFSDTAPKELKDLFLDHYEIRGLDYQIFSIACDTIVEAWNNNNDSPTLLQDYLDNNYNDFSSPYNADRLAYLNIWNDEEIADILKDFSSSSVSEACAVWFDRQVEEAISVILNKYLLI